MAEHKTMGDVTDATSITIYEISMIEPSGLVISTVPVVFVQHRDWVILKDSKKNTDKTWKYEENAELDTLDWIHCFESCLLTQDAKKHHLPGS